MSGEVKKRAYSSPARQARAEATRAAIIEAATSLFLADGYARTSTKAIARTAHTSEASLFAVFGSKAELLVAVTAHHVTQHGDFPLRGQPVWRTLRTDSGSGTGTDPGPAIDEFARVVRRAHERSWRLLAVVAAAKDDDPALSAAATAAAQRRHEDCRWFVAEVAGADPDTVARKTDVVWTLISVENYRHLVVERGWAPEDYEVWLAAQLRAALSSAGADPEP